MTKALLASVLFASSLAACTTMRAPHALTAAQLLNDDPTAECLVASNRDPRLLVLESKIGSLRAAGQASVVMLSSKELPTPAEKSALEFWGNERQRCLGQGAAYRTTYLPAAVVSTFEIGQRDLLLLTAKLYAGDLNFGQFNVQRQELATSHRQKYVEFEQQLAAAAGRPPAGTMDSARMPVQTNCHRYADISWNCTSQ